MLVFNALCVIMVVLVETSGIGVFVLVRQSILLSVRSFPTQKNANNNNS